MICTTNRNGASCTAYSTASEIITTASNNAQCTALRATRMPSAQTTMIGARIQNAIIRGPRRDGSAASILVGCSRVVTSVATRRRQRAAVVVALVVAQPHRVRRLLHAREQRSEEVGLLVDQVGAVVVGQLVLVRHRERSCGARLDAQPAQDAAQVVDLVHAAVALARREPLVLGVGRTFDVDRVGRARPGAELAADALLQPVGPAVELVPAVEARSRLLLDEGVLLGDDLAEHGAEGDPEPGHRVPVGLLDGRHQYSLPAGPRTGMPSSIGGTG